MKKGWKRTAAIACGLALLSGCAAADGSVTEPVPKAVNYTAEDHDSWDMLMEENRISDTFEHALSQFTFRSGSRILSESGGNMNYSPLSLYYAMAIAGCGAEGETAGQIMDQLGMEDQKELYEQCRKLYQWFYYDVQRQKAWNDAQGEGNDSRIQLGNSLWISDQLKIKKDYRKMVAGQCFAPSYQVDFNSQEAGEQISSWISRQTGGVLQPSLDLDSETMMTILNTLYFYDGWKDNFLKKKTADDNFNQSDGSKVVCAFMNRTEEFGKFRKGDGYTVSAMRTSNGCDMVFLLPDQGRSVEEILNTPELLQDAMSTDYKKWEGGEVSWKVPKFSFGSTLELSELLKAMGADKMFTKKAEFGKISKEPLFVKDVIQETHIAIDEDGVEGAAYTMIRAEAYCIVEAEERPKADMILDRPFIYGIQDSNTGTWLFLGVCRNPAEMQ